MNAHNAALLNEYPTLWTRHDVDAVIALFTDDCCYEDAVLGWIHRGKVELREFAAAVFTMHPDFRLRYLSSFATDQRGAAEWIIDASFEGEFEGIAVARRPVSFRGTTLFEFRDGRICRNTDFWDYADWMRQLGIMTLRSPHKPGDVAARPHAVNDSRGMMVTREFAESFAQHWVAAWNAHDLEKILSHYAQDFEMSSPYIVEIAQQASGKLQGKAAVGAYWRAALEKMPSLHFELINVLVSVDSVTINYQGVRGAAAEVFFFDSAGLVVRACAHYA